jgi:hypothetical protein
LLVLSDAYRLGTRDTPRFDRALGNLAFVARLVARHLVEVGGVVGHARALRLRRSSTPHSPLHHLGRGAHSLAVVAFVVDVPVTPRNYWVHFELVTLFVCALERRVVWSRLAAAQRRLLRRRRRRRRTPCGSSLFCCTILLCRAPPPALDGARGRRRTAFLYSLAASAFDTIVSFTGGARGAAAPAAATGSASSDASPSRGAAVASTADAGDGPDVGRVAG